MNLVDISRCIIKILVPEPLQPNTMYIGEIPTTYKICLERKNSKSAVLLGEYPTKEKAIKVLDDIQDYVRTCEVFEMPQYDEV